MTPLWYMMALGALYSAQVATTTALVLWALTV